MYTKHTLIFMSVFSIMDAFCMAERFNGILGNFHTNKHDVEFQVMRKFLSGQQIRTAPLEEEMHELNTLLQSAHQVKGSMLQTQLPSQIASHANLEELLSENSCLFRPVKKSVFTTSQIQEITNICSKLYSHPFTILRIHKQSRAIIVNGEAYGSVNSRQKNSSLIKVKSHEQNSAFPCFVTPYYKVVIQIDESSEQTNILLVGVIPLLPTAHKNYFGVPLEVWLQPHSLEQYSMFVPFSSVICRCAYYDCTNYFPAGTSAHNIIAISPINNSVLRT